MNNVLALQMVEAAVALKAVNDAVEETVSSMAFWASMKNYEECANLVPVRREQQATYDGMIAMARALGVLDDLRNIILSGTLESAG